MPRFESRDFPNEMEARKFIKEKNLFLKGSPLIPEKKELGVNECFLISSLQNEHSFGGPRKWVVIYRLPDEEKKRHPL